MDINPATADYSALGDSVRVLGGDVTSFEDVIKAAWTPSRTHHKPRLPARLRREHAALLLPPRPPRHDNCFEAARLCGVNRVVYASSFAVSGLQRHFGDRALNEDDPAFGSNSTP